MVRLRLKVRSSNQLSYQPRSGFVRSRETAVQRMYYVRAAEGVARAAGGGGACFWNARKDRLVAEGRCMACGLAEARPDRLLCWSCGERDTRRKCPTLRRAVRCGLCKRGGHDRRRCPGPGVRRTR